MPYLIVSCPFADDSQKRIRALVKDRGNGHRCAKMFWKTLANAPDAEWKAKWCDNVFKLLDANPELIPVAVIERGKQEAKSCKWERAELRGYLDQRFSNNDFHAHSFGWFEENL